MSELKLKRASDGWVFDGDWAEYTPPKPKIKTNEITTIRGVSRFQSLGHAGSTVKFKLRFYIVEEANDFMNKYDSEYQFTDELGLIYRGVFKDDIDLKTIAEGGKRIYELGLTFNSVDIVGVGYIATN